MTVLHVTGLHVTGLPLVYVIAALIFEGRYTTADGANVESVPGH